MQNSCKQSKDQISMDEVPASFTKRKKQEKITADDPRWKRPDANLLQYMSKLKEQYLQRQTEYDQQAKRIKADYDQRGLSDYDQQAKHRLPDYDQQAKKEQADCDQLAKQGQTEVDQNTRRGQTDYEQQSKRGHIDYDQQAKIGQTDYDQRTKRGLIDYDQQAKRGQTDYDQKAKGRQKEYDQQSKRGQADYDQPGKRVKVLDVGRKDAKDVKLNVHFHKAIEPIPSGLYKSFIEMSTQMRNRRGDLSRALRAVKHKSLIPVRSPPKRTAASQNKEVIHEQKDVTPASKIKERSHLEQGEVKQEKPKEDGSYSIPQHPSSSRLKKPEAAVKDGSSDNENTTNTHRNRLSFTSFKDNKKMAQRRNTSAPHGSPDPIRNWKQNKPEQINRADLMPLAGPETNAGEHVRERREEIKEYQIQQTIKESFNNLKQIGVQKKAPSKKPSPSRAATPLDTSKVQSSIPRGSNKEQKNVVVQRTSPKQKLFVEKPLQISRWSGVVVTEDMDKTFRSKRPIKFPVKLRLNLRKPPVKLQRRDSISSNPLAAVKSEPSPVRKTLSKQDPIRKKPQERAAAQKSKELSPQLKPKSASPHFDGVSNKELPPGSSHISAKTAPREFSPPQKRKPSPTASPMSSSYNSRLSNESMRSILNSKKRVGSSAISAKGKPISSMEGAKQRLSPKQKLLHRSTSVPCNSLSPIASIEFQSESDSHLLDEVESIKSIPAVDKKMCSKSTARRTPDTNSERSSAKKARLRKDRVRRSLDHQRKEKKTALFATEFDDLAAGEQSSSGDRNKPSTRKDTRLVKHEKACTCSPSGKKKRYDDETVFQHENQTRQISDSPEKELSLLEKIDAKAWRKRDLVERRQSSSLDKKRNLTAVQYHKEAHIPYGHRVRRRGHHCCRGVHLVHDGRQRMLSRVHRARIFASDRLRPKRCLHSCRLGKPHGYKTSKKLMSHRMKMRPVSTLTHQGWNESDTDYSEMKHARHRRKYALRLEHEGEDLTSDNCCYTYDFDPNSGDYSTGETDTDLPYVLSETGDASELMDSTYSDCCEFEPRGSPQLKQRDAIQVTWNMSESNVPVHSSTYTAIRRYPEKCVDSKYNPGARSRPNPHGERIVSKNKDLDRVPRQGSVPLKSKAPSRLQRNKTTLQSTDPGFMQRPTKDDQPREGQLHSDQLTASSSDVIEGARLQKPEMISDSHLGGNRGNDVMDEIEEEMNDVLASLFQSQYSIAIRVETLKEDLMHQVSILQASPKPVPFLNKPIATRPVAKWAGTYYDYIMMLGFMVVQFVFQFVIVKKY